MSEDNDNTEQDNLDNLNEEVNEETHEFPEKLSEMTGYDHLYIMCKQVRNDSGSHSGFFNPITPRLRYIMDALATQGINFEFVPLKGSWGATDLSSVSADVEKLANVMVTFKGHNSDKPAVIFTAHHDIANPNSENCQDNTASVCNLLHLCSKLKTLQANNELEQDVIIGFTDCEEAGGRGMNKLINEIQNNKYGDIEAIFALELTANGTELWVEGVRENSLVSQRVDRSVEGNVKRVRTPYNEAVNARRHRLPAVCIGTLTPQEMEEATSRGYCSTWALCHRLADTFENSANKEDMTNFVDAMVKMIDLKKKEEEFLEDENANQVTIFDAIEEAERKERERNAENNNYSAAYFPNFLRKLN